MGTHDELRDISDRWREYVNDDYDRTTDDGYLSEDWGPVDEPVPGMRYDLVISWDDDHDDGMAGWVGTFLTGSVRAFVPGAVVTFVDHQS